jgi:hypothetical protein
VVTIGQPDHLTCKIRVVCVMTHDDDHARESCALREDTVSYVTTSVSWRMCRPAAPVLHCARDGPPRSPSLVAEVHTRTRGGVERRARGQF